MKYPKWLLAAVFAVLTGVFYVLYLTVHPLRMSLFMFLSTVSLALLVATIAIWFRKAALAVVIPLSLILFVVGWWLMSLRFMATPDLRTSPELTRQPGDPDKGHTAVVYFTHGEPETYNPIGWVNQFREFDEQGIPFVPLLVRPLFAQSLRKHYLIVGRSNHRFMHHQMIKALERRYREEGDSITQFYISFLDDSPTPEAAAIMALNEGCSRMVVSEVFLTVSNHTAEGENQIKELEIEERFGIPVRFTGPLYDSETLKRMFVERANANLAGVDKEKVGILLVGHGQPDEWDEEWPTETEHETGFREGVLDRLVEDGYKRENVSLAWMEFKEPHPAPKVEEFVAGGVERVLFFSAAISADAMHSQYDVPALVGEADVPEGIELVNLGAWNDDPIVIQAIKEKIDAELYASDEVASE
jgi:protoheme ferro-lyase